MSEKASVDSQCQTVHEYCVRLASRVQESAHHRSYKFPRANAAVGKEADNDSVRQGIDEVASLSERIAEVSQLPPFGPIDRLDISGDAFVAWQSDIEDLWDRFKSARMRYRRSVHSVHEFVARLLIAEYGRVFFDQDALKLFSIGVQHLQLVDRLKNEEAERIAGTDFSDEESDQLTPRLPKAFLCEHLPMNTDELRAALDDGRLVEKSGMKRAAKKIQLVEERKKGTLYFSLK